LIAIILSLFVLFGFSTFFLSSSIMGHVQQSFSEFSKKFFSHFYECLSLSMQNAKQENPEINTNAFIHLI